MDDLLDLNWSSAAPNNAAAAAGKSQLQSQFRSTPSPSPSSFDFLASQPSSGAKPNYSTSTPILRPSTPSTAPIAPSARLAAPPVPLSGRSSPNPPSSQTQSQSQGDAFSSLLSLGSSSSSANQNISLAQRQQQLAEEKRRKAEHEMQQFEAHGAFWDNLGSSSSSTKTTPPPSNGFDDLLSPHPTLAPVPAPARISRPSSALSNNILPEKARSNANTAPLTTWDDDDFLAGPSNPSNPSKPFKTPQQIAPKVSPDPFDFDALGSNVDNLAAPTNGKGSSGMRTPVSDFDFGDRQDKDFGDDDDDLLGELGRPAKPLSARREQSPPSPPRQAPRVNASARPTSPPPHIVGQIVEMGFTPAQARQALAKTPTGVDVEAALETLLAQHTKDDSDDEDRVLHEQRRREEEEKERRRRRRAGPSRDSVKARTREERDVAPEYGEQADKIIAQASEIGQNVLSRATMFWNAGKERAMKAYEEQRKALELEQKSKGKTKDGRPRWMIEAEAQAEEDDSPQKKKEKGGGGFKDSDDDDDEAPPPVRERRRPEPKPQRKETHHDLLFGDEPKSYQPASRRAPPSSSSKPSPRPIATPPPLFKRDLVKASSAQITSSTNHKLKGNEHFKLGRFSEAESSYSSAISSLPDRHLLLVPIYNNRAATRLKLGQSDSAVQDCTVVIELVGPTYHPAKEAPLPAHLIEVKLGDALVKATSKRAQAWEMAEKWSKAVEDWERVMGFDAALLGSNASSTRNQAVEGARRARRMLEEGDRKAAPATAPAAPKPSNATKPKAQPKPVDTNKSAAVSELRKAAQAAEAEDAQRLAVKDAVDAKVQAWKGGKETNLRALIASLDTILWDDILKGGLKVGMHELIQEKQVKIKYMKVIARLHPDKLDVKGTTVEQRMLANAAFSALNDAWQAFNNP